MLSQPDVEKKQILHISESLRILYQKFFQLPWARTWEEIVDSMVTIEVSKDGNLKDIQPVIEQHPQETQIKMTPPREIETPYKHMLDTFRTELNIRQYSEHTIKSYLHWARRFIVFHGLKSPHNLRSKAVNTYLGSLADEQNVSPSTQNQARNALLFLYEHVLEEPLGEIGSFTKARQSQRFSGLLTADDIDSLLTNLTGNKVLIAALLYGSGLRVMECLRLRIKDIDFNRKEITVRDSKGRQDRLTLLPEHLQQQLQEHLTQVRELHDRDLEQCFLQADCRSTLKPKRSGEIISTKISCRKQ
jgi:site-specific recombinase XerD